MPTNNKTKKKSRLIRLKSSTVIEGRVSRTINRTGFRNVSGLLFNTAVVISLFDAILIPVGTPQNCSFVCINGNLLAFVIYLMPSVLVLGIIHFISLNRSFTADDSRPYMFYVIGATLLSIIIYLNFILTALML